VKTINHLTEPLIFNLVRKLGSVPQRGAREIQSPSINFQDMSRQIRSARLAVSMGSAALVAGMLYGTQVGNCPYPQLALGAHVQFMVAGMMGILAGLVLNSQSICQLDDSPTLLKVIDIAHYVLIVPSGAEGYAAFKGLGMPLVNTIPILRHRLIPSSLRKDTRSFGNIVIRYSRPCITVLVSPCCLAGWGSFTDC
jgi:hypothetical protein